MKEKRKNQAHMASKPATSDRDERLRKALRDNLSKRKAQTRARKAEQEK